MKHIGYLIAVLFMASMATASYVLPDHGVTQAKLALRATSTSVAAGGVAVSASSGNFTTTSGSATAVTNLSVTIVTTGRPVYVGLIPDGSATLSYLGADLASSLEAAGVFRFTKGGVDLAITALEVNGASAFQTNHVPPGSFYVIDQPAAGTYTYAVKANSGFGSTTVSVLYTKLIAYEL